MKFSIFCLVAVAAQASAQPSGPIVRSLGVNYYLVQCNALRLQPDDAVVVVRQGQEVGAGKVMRCDDCSCSIMLTAGEARRLDLVVLKGRKSDPADRGPTLPVPMLVGAPRLSGVSTRVPDAKASKGNYFTTHNASGTVYNLNTGEYLTKP